MAANRSNTQCNKCNKKLNFRSQEIIPCDGICKKYFHISCVKLDSKRYSKIIENKEDWLCNECVKTRDNRRASVTASTSTVTQKNSKASTVQTSDVKYPENNLEFQKMVIDKLDQIVGWNLDNRVQDLETKMAETIETVDTHDDEMLKMQNEIILLNNRIKKIRKSN